MSTITLFSILESPTHPDFSRLYYRLKINSVKLNSMRKAISKLKEIKPDYVVAEFFYGYGNNYAGVNISNLDVFLYSLQKYAPHARVIVMVEKSEREYVDKLNDLFPLYAILQYTSQQLVREKEIEELLQ